MEPLFRWVGGVGTSLISSACILRDSVTYGLLKFKKVVELCSESVEVSTGDLCLVSIRSHVGMMFPAHGYH